MRQVVNGISADNFLKRKITLRALLDQQACTEGIVWFVERFGTEALFDVVYNLSLTTRSKQDTEWLAKNKEFFPFTDPNKIGPIVIDKKFVSINDVTINKVYLMKFKTGHVYKLHNFNGLWYWMNLKSSAGGFARSYNTMKDAIKAHIHKEEVKIYEFEGSLEIRDHGAPPKFSIQGTQTGRF